MEFRHVRHLNKDCHRTLHLFGGACRTAGEAGMGNVPISGIAPGPANAGGLNNVMVDPSGIANAAKVVPLPQPRITVPVVPKFK
jgi:hypothetical protein